MATMAACGPAEPAATTGSETSSATDGATDGATAVVPTSGAATSGTSTGTSTGAAEASDGSGTGQDDGLAEHGPCPTGNECALCVQAEGASVCGPECYEYGPGTAPGRCPKSAIQEQSICPSAKDVPNVCLIMCEATADCPDPGMVCVACPAPFMTACEALWVFSETGPNICAWPSA